MITITTLLRLRYVYDFLFSPGFNVAYDHQYYNCNYDYDASVNSPADVGCVLRPVYTGDFCRRNSMQLNAIFVTPKLQPAAISLRF